jgi:hypothetical protein
MALKLITGRLFSLGSFALLSDLNSILTQRFCGTLIIVLWNKQQLTLSQYIIQPHYATYISLITAGVIDLYSIALWLCSMATSGLCEHGRLPHRPAVLTYVFFFQT